MRFVQFEDVNGKAFNLEFPTDYDCDEFLAKYWFVEARLKTEGYEIILQGPSQDEQERIEETECPFCGGTMKLISLGGGPNWLCKDCGKVGAHKDNYWVKQGYCEEFGSAGRPEYRFPSKYGRFKNSELGENYE